MSACISGAARVFSFKSIAMRGAITLSDAGRNSGEEVGPISVPVLVGRFGSLTLNQN